MEATKAWNTLETDRKARLQRALTLSDGKVVQPEDAQALLETVIRPGDRVCIEGNNQKQADFLSKALASVDPSLIHDLHLVQSVVGLDEHLDLFSKGIAKKLDFAFSGPQAKRLAEYVQNGTLQLGAIHTYLELYARYCLDLTPRVALVAAEAADRHGNLYTGPNTEDTPIVVEATQFKQGIVIAQVNRLVDELPRVDIPGDWVDFVIPAPTPYYLDPLFTRDPAKIGPTQILMAMMALKLYEEYGVKKLNHGIGYATAAIELILPTYGKELGLLGKVATHWALNPHPTLIPAIESGFVEAIHSFGSEVGMESYIQARPDVFSIGPDGNMRSNRMICQAIGHYGIDLFIGATMQIDEDGNSSTATKGRISGFGGAPNMGTNAGGRRHWTEAWGKMGEGYGFGRALDGEMPRGRKLVVQMLETKHAKGPNFVEKLDAWELAETAGLPLPPVMIYGSDLTHIISEEGIAYLYRAESLEERRKAIRAIAGDTPLGRKSTPEEKEEMRRKGLVKTPEDLGIDRARATRELLAAKDLADLVRWSGGLYQIPSKFA